MHFHANLRRQLLDLDRKVYRTDMAHTAAAQDAIDLRHHCTYLHSALAASPALTETSLRMQRKHR